MPADLLGGRHVESVVVPRRLEVLGGRVMTEIEELGPVADLLHFAVKFHVVVGRQDA